MKNNIIMFIGFGGWIFAALIVALRLFFPSHFLLQYFPYSIYGYLFLPFKIEEISHNFYGILLAIAADWVITVLSIYFIIAIFWNLFFFCNRILQRFRK